MLTDLQAQTIRAVVNVFETGSPRGNYACVTCVQGDAGHLTYGRSQASLTSGNLYRLVNDYCGDPGAACAAELRPFLRRLEARDTALDRDAGLKNALERAGSDPVMRDAQDAFFAKSFFYPATKAAENSHVFSALGTAVVYDSIVQGGWQIVRKIVVAKSGAVSGSMDEQQWIAAYVEARREWLEAAGGLLATSAYRMREFRNLIDCGKWELALPLVVRGVVLDLGSLYGAQRRTLRLETPTMTGEDVEQLQSALAAQGFGVEPDGVFGAETAAALKRFQAARGLAPDGVAGPQTWAAVLKAKAAGL